MRKLFLFVAVLSVVSALYSQNISYTLLSSNQNEAVVRVDFGSYTTSTVVVNGTQMQTLNMSGAYPVMRAGSPELLQTAFSLIVPENSRPETEIIDAQYTVVEHFALAPSKGKLYRNQDPSTVAYMLSTDYQSTRDLLVAQAEIGDTYQMRDFNGVSVKVFPFNYNPSAQTLKVYSSLTVKVRYNGARAFSAAQKNNRTFDAVYAHHFLNYSLLRGTSVVEQGDMLIICPDEFMEAMQPYVNWKIKNGYATEMVSVTAAGGNANAIKNYISNYYDNHNLAFVVIVGDNAQFPTPTLSGNKSDNYFTEIVGNDSYPDVVLGKISAETVAQVETQVQRFVEYEQNPSETSHFTSFLGIASNQGPGDNSEYDYQHIRNIGQKLENYTYTSGYELFEGSQGGLDASGNPTAAMVTTAVNSGVGIITYCGHGDVQMWVTTGFNNNNVNALTNVGKLPFILSVACVNGEYHTGTCFAEAWTRATHEGQPSGAVGILGSTINQPWNSPMCAQDAMIDLLVGTDGTQTVTFGGMFFNGVIHMLDVYSDNEVARTWILFGDPTLQMRTAVPEQLELSYSSVLPAGIPSVTFSSLVENAKVTVTNHDEIVAVGHISNGSYVFEFSDTYLPTDTLRVLATATNYLPYEGFVTFVPNDGPYVIVGDLALTDEHLWFDSNKPNNMPEFGKVMKAIPQIMNIGSQSSSSVKVRISTNDDYIRFVGPSGYVTDLVLEIPVVAARDTVDTPPFFFFKVNDLAPANHNAVLQLETTFNDDTVRQNKSVKLYAPQMAITALSIDDTEEGNGNRRVDYAEAFDCLITITNTGNMPITGGTLFLENSGNELLLQADSVLFPAIEANGSVTVRVHAVASDTIQEPTTTFLKTSLWVNYYFASANFPVKIGAVIENWETADFSNMNWVNTSSKPWMVSSQTPYEGSYCAKSGAIGDNANTRLQITVESVVSDTLSFFYKVSSEANYDKLVFKIDGQTKDEWSGTIGWTRAAYPVEAGVHTYSWTYSKDSYMSSGKDCAYIDAISFPSGRINHPLSVSEINSCEISVWPNPAIDVVRVQPDDNGQDFTYQLFNIAGKLLQGGRLSGTPAEIDMRSCSPGVYLLKVEDNKHRVTTAKIIKK